jgi:hypothetical protein
MGAGAREQLRLSDAERRGLAARLGSTGANLIPALDNLDAAAARALPATGLERDAVDAWQDALKGAARQLEAAWLALERAVDSEEQRWRWLADDVAQWRKPVWPVALVGVTSLAVAAWLGLVFGGYLEAPAWLQAVWQRILGQ